MEKQIFGNLASILFPVFETINLNSVTSISDDGVGAQPQEQLEAEDLLADSYLNIAPGTAFYLNEGVSILIMGLSTAYYLLAYAGIHDKYQWYMHLFVWGQT